MASDRKVRLESLKQQMVRLGGQTGISKASIERLEADIANAKRTIKSPIDGLMGEVSEMPPGTVSAPGRRIAGIAPRGELKIVAQFFANEALGRGRAGQRARLRLNAFPWTQYGTVQGDVLRVASEPKAGLLRAEIRVGDKSSKLILYQHGLIGTVEVAVERATPAMLLLRSLGKLVGRPDDGPPDSAQGRGTAVGSDEGEP